MIKAFAEKNIEYLTFQRNILFFLLMLISIALIICCSFLFLKQERVIIVPPKIEKELWVEVSNVSPTYLEQFGLFLSQLLLSKSAYSAPSQRLSLLRHTDPAYAGLLNQKLLEEEELLKKQNASYVFYPLDVKVNSTKMEIELVGDRVLIVLDKTVSSEKEHYVMSFSYSGSRLLLSGINRKRVE